MTSPRGSFDRAIVVGASMAGMLAAAVLARHFRVVTVIERDEMTAGPEPRKGVPQGRHAHALLCKGQSIIADLFPGMFEEMVAAGAQRVDMGMQAAWLHFGGWKARHQSGLSSYYQSRPFLDWHVRRRVQDISNIEFLRADVQQLLASPAGIRGVLFSRRGTAESPVEMLAADLVVDASGRGSHAPRWLEELGYEKPPESSVQIDGGYATRIYRRPREIANDRRVVILYPDPPRTIRIGYIFPIEDDRWLVTLGSRAADFPPTDEESYLEYARSLTSPIIYDSIRNAEPLSDIVGNRFKANRWRHYEALRRFPEGLIVLGDALCSYNPAYGQGMTVCALEADLLDRCVVRQLRTGKLSGLADRFRKRAGRIVATPWLLATSEDFRYPQTLGKRPFYMRALTWYTARMHRRSTVDPVVYGAFLRVMQMVAAPSALFRPNILCRVLAPLPRRQSITHNISVTAEFKEQ